MGSIYHTTIIGRRQVAQDTLEVSLKRPDEFSFWAGQYIQLGVQELLYSDPKGSSRIMSIASSPLDRENISVAFRKTGSGFKCTLEELPIGAPILVEGQHGYFTLPENMPQPMILIAGGIGITPYLSMIRYATEKGLKIPMTLLYANTNKESAAYLDELSDLARKNDNFTFKNSFGGLTRQFIRQNTKNVRDPLWYIAGPPAMVDLMRNNLFLAGVEDGKICFEEFMGY